MGCSPAARTSLRRASSAALSRPRKLLRPPVYLPNGFSVTAFAVSYVARKKTETRKTLSAAGWEALSGAQGACRRPLGLRNAALLCSASEQSQLAARPSSSQLVSARLSSYSTVHDSSGSDALKRRRGEKKFLRSELAALTLSAARLAASIHRLGRGCKGLRKKDLCWL